MHTIIEIGVPHLTLVGYYAGPVTGMSCLVHGNRQRYKSQPMSIADVVYEGYNPEAPWEWCAGCAKKFGRDHGHEYTIDRLKAGQYGVLDLSFGDGTLYVFCAPLYSTCEQWIEGVPHGRKLWTC